MPNAHEKFIHYVGNKYEFLLFYCDCSKALGQAIQNFSVSLSQTIMVKMYMAHSYFNCKEHLCVQKYHINISGELHFCPSETHAHVSYSSIQFQHICETYITNNFTYTT